jgi:hypothetical protein
LDRSFWCGLAGALSGHVHLSIKGRRTAEGRFDWQEAAIDAGIISGLTFFTGLGALAAGHAVNVDGLVVLFCSTGGEFLSVLAAKRKLTPPAK